jgi:uncharacterized membrane protein
MKTLTALIQISAIMIATWLGASFFTVGTALTFAG